MTFAEVTVSGVRKVCALTGRRYRLRKREMPIHINGSEAESWPGSEGVLGRTQSIKGSLFTVAKDSERPNGGTVGLNTMCSS